MTSPRKGRHAVIGIDFGTLSGRAVVVSVDDGTTLGSAVHEYGHGVLTETLPGSDRRLPHDWALQVPSDYVDVLRNAVPKALAASGVSAEYATLHDYFGRGTNDVMHRLRALQRTAGRD